MAAYAGTSPRRRGVRGEVVELHHRRHQRGPPLDHGVDEVGGQAGAVLDAVDARLDELGQDRGAEAVRGDAGAVLVGGRDGLGERLRRERRGEVALVAGDPVADQLHPAVATLRLAGDVRRELGRLDLVGVVADVALGPRDVPSGTDQPGQVLAVVHPRRVGGRSAVAQQQRPGVAVGDRLLLGGRLVHRAVVVEAHVAVGVDQAGHDPAATGVLGRRDGLVGDVPVDDVEVARLSVGQHRSTEPQRGLGSSHAPDATGPGMVAAVLLRAAGRAARRDSAPSPRGPGPGPGASGRRSPR